MHGYVVLKLIPISDHVCSFDTLCQFVGIMHEHGFSLSCRKSLVCGFVIYRYYFLGRDQLTLNMVIMNFCSCVE